MGNWLDNMALTSFFMIDIKIAAIDKNNKIRLK